MIPEIKVGMKLYYVPHSDWDKPKEVVVTEKGKKWARLNNGQRFEFKSDSWYFVDGGGYNSPGKLWLSKEEYEEQKEAKRILGKIANKFQYAHQRNGVSLNDAIAAAKILGVEF